MAAQPGEDSDEEQQQYKLPLEDSASDSSDSEEEEEQDRENRHPNIVKSSSAATLKFASHAIRGALQALEASVDESNYTGE